MSAIQLIVGLANPGKEYVDTRHNAGAWFVEEVAQEANASLKLDKKYHGLYGFAKLHQAACHLLIPTTFMNLSGQSVKACASYHNLSPDSILVAHDDIDLPTGVIKLKFDGGDGGHNGLKDIIRHLHTKQFYRLRIGVGRPAQGEDVADYVLHNPSKAERKLIDENIIRAQSVLPFLFAGEMQKAMQALHTET